MIYQLAALLLFPLTLSSPTGTNNFNNVVDNDMYDNKMIVSTMGITTWPVKACQGPPSDTHTHLIYGSAEPGTIASFTLTRDMNSREQLDILGFAPGQSGDPRYTPGACNQYLYSEAYQTKAGTPAICYNTKAVGACFHWKRNVTLNEAGCVKGQLCKGETV